MQTSQDTNRSGFLSFCYAMAVTVAASASTNPVPCKQENMPLHFTHTILPHKIILHKADVSPAEFFSLSVVTQVLLSDCKISSLL